LRNCDDLPMSEPRFTDEALAAPDLRPGDSWTFDVRDADADADAAQAQPLAVHSRVVAVDAGVVELDVRRGDEDWLRTRMDPLLGVLERELAPGDSLRYTPALTQLRFPLRVGRRWNATVRRCQEQWWQEDELHTEGEVLGASWIDVPAGRFAALHLRFACRLPQGRVDAELWYAPAAARVVRGIEHTRSDDDDVGVRVEFVLQTLNRLRSI
jgi:hypothetical protein